MTTWVIEPLALTSDLDTILEIEQAAFVNRWTREMYLAELENRGVACCHVVRTAWQRVVGLWYFARSRDRTRSRRWSMNEQSQGLRDLLLQTDEEFHNLAAKHHELEDRLHELTAKHYLSEPEQLEQVTLKKRKLQLKDRMEDILRRHRQQA